MKLEDHLVQKTFYEKKFMEEVVNEHPIRVLGNYYVKEQQKEVGDLSYVRFAQGEVYFHYNDFEAAIFKWENIHNELEPWAKKNMADAYFELDLLKTAEDIYQSISTESLILNTEVALQLFALYIEKGEMEAADEMIKNAVILNPDYPNVTSVARAFFEEQQDWDSAVELAVNEAIRTKSLSWFRKLHSDIKARRTQSYDPAYFRHVLFELHEVDQFQFERVVSDVWESYHEHESYLLWLQEINELILALNCQSSTQLDQWYSKAFDHLLGGPYDVAQLHEVIPQLLTAWQRVTDSTVGLYASSALLSWNDLFPTTLDQASVREARKLLTEAKADRNLIHDSKQLFQAIKNWASKQQLHLGKRADWMFDLLMNSDNRRIAIASSTHLNKSSFVQFLLDQAGASEEYSTMPIIYSYEEEENRSNQQEGDETEDYSVDMLTKYNLHNRFLQEQKIALLELPKINFTREQETEMLDFLRLTDNMLYILDEVNPFTKQERNFLLNIKNHFPQYEIHFILQDENQESGFVDEYKERLRSHFPGADIFRYSTYLGREHQLNELANMINRHVDVKRESENRLKNGLYFIREAIKFLLQQQVTVEKELEETIELDEATLAKLNGSIHQLHDIEEEKVTIIQQAYQLLKEEIKANLSNKIPELIKSSADIIKEDSDFGKVHLELNEEMNERVSSYLQKVVMPIYNQSLQEWITYAESELNESQERLIEWTESFNLLMGEERLRLECDFQVLSDWQRDAERMATSIQMDEENILLKRTPSQVLLKSAGKLFGVIPANNAVLYKRYISFIENEDYEEATNSIIAKFFRQFELFEQAIPRDIALFFREPIGVLKENVDHLHAEVESNKNLLSKMRAQPEIFRDPLTLFEVRMRQIERMSQLGDVAFTKTMHN